jgi:6-phospho-beta-glucosidase
MDIQTKDFDKAAEEGYSGVALDIIETLHNGGNRILILNVLNNGAVLGMQDFDSVEIPVCIGKGFVRPISVGKIPGHCLGLMQQVKAYEKLTIEAAIEGSYAKALNALTIHPLVRDEKIAVNILAGYIKQHGAFFPVLK